jgi:hypothetical protein
MEISPPRRKALWAGEAAGGSSSAIRKSQTVGLIPFPFANISK